MNRLVLGGGRWVNLLPSDDDPITFQATIGSQYTKLGIMMVSKALFRDGDFYPTSSWHARHTVRMNEEPEMAADFSLGTESMCDIPGQRSSFLTNHNFNTQSRGST